MSLLRGIIEIDMAEWINDGMMTELAMMPLKKGAKEYPGYYSTDALNSTKL